LTAFPGAEEHYQRSLELKPNNAASWHDHAVFVGNLRDWAGVDRAIGLPRGREWSDTARVVSVQAFWLAVQGRYDETAPLLLEGEPIPEVWIPAVFGGRSTWIDGNHAAAHRARDRSQS